MPVAIDDDVVEMMAKYGVKRQDLDFVTSYLVASSKLYERSHDPDMVSRFLRKHDGVITQHFIPPSYFGGEDDFRAVFLSVAFGWRYGGVTLRGDGELFSAIAASEPMSEIPRAWVDMIPCPTVRLPIYMTHKDEDFDFFLSRRWYKGNDCLIFSFGQDGHLTQDIVYNINDAPDGFITLTSDDPEAADTIASIISAMLFTCSMIPHNEAQPKPIRRVSKKGVVDYTLQARTKPVDIDCGFQQKAYLEKEGIARESLQAHSRKAHLRRAHWRSYWIGPRDGERSKILKWIPPTFVKGFK